MEEEEQTHQAVPVLEDISIVYFCRECQKVVAARSMGRRKKYTFKCPECENVCAYGTSRGIVNFFRIKEGSENWNFIQEGIKK